MTRNWLPSHNDLKDQRPVVDQHNGDEPLCTPYELKPPRDLDGNAVEGCSRVNEPSDSPAGFALVRAIPIAPTLLRRDDTTLGVVTLLLLGLVGWDLRLDPHDGVSLSVLPGVCLSYLFTQRRAGADDSHEEDGHDDQGDVSLSRDAALLLVGLLCIVAIAMLRWGFDPSAPGPGL